MVTWSAATQCRYTGHTFAKFVVTFVIGVVTGCFAVALGKCNGILIDSKLEFIQTQMDNYEGNTPLAAFVGFLWFWLFGAIMVAIATSMVSGIC